MCCFQTALKRVTNGTRITAALLPPPRCAAPRRASPFFYVSRCIILFRLAHNNGAITQEDADRWLKRLEWEAASFPEAVFGTLNLYVVAGVKPQRLSNAVKVDTATHRPALANGV